MAIGFYSAAIVLNGVMYRLSEDEFKLIATAVDAYRDVLKEKEKDLKDDADMEGWLKDVELQDTVACRLTDMWDERVEG
jgi:hypothetical protein